MKKIMLVSALIFAGLVNAKNSVSNSSELKNETANSKFSKQLCGIIVTFYDSYGNPYDQRWYTSDQPDIFSCMAYQSSVVSNLQSQGYVVNKAVTKGLL